MERQGLPMPSFPELAFLPIEDLLIHERHDDQRIMPLILRLRSNGILRNPPIAAPLQDGTSRYMVLDGANRVTALREMGCPHLVAQIVHPEDPGLNLQTWNHVVWELNAARFLSGIRRICGVRLIPLAAEEETEPKLEGECGVMQVQSAHGRRYMICAPGESLEQRVDLLNAVVDSYSTRARLDRTSLRDVHQLLHIYPSLSGLVIFPSFNIHDLLKLAGEEYLLPTGITRFMIAPRALHLNLPLENLFADRPLEEKNIDLRKWIQQQVALKRVRYYAEPTYLFDE
jgi:L-serine kinase (ATP) / ParB family transcriptional regulator, heme-responsive regulator